MKTTSTMSALCKNRLIPKEQLDATRFNEFRQTVQRFLQIMLEAGVKAIPLNEEDVVGNSERFGLLESIVNVSFSGVNNNTLQDLHIEDGTFMIGDKYLSCHSISELDSLPSEVGTMANNSKLSSPPFLSSSLTLLAWVCFFLSSTSTTNISFR